MQSKRALLAKRSNSAGQLTQSDPQSSTQSMASEKKNLEENTCFQSQASEKAMFLKAEQKTILLKKSDVSQSQASEKAIFRKEN